MTMTCWLPTPPRRPASSSALRNLCPLQLPDSYSHTAEMPDSHSPSTFQPALPPRLPDSHSPPTFQPALRRRAVAAPVKRRRAVTAAAERRTAAAVAVAVVRRPPHAWLTCSWLRRARRRASPRWRLSDGGTARRDRRLTTVSATRRTPFRRRRARSRLSSGIPS
jgi:type IV secretory pathway VirB10-like protein